MTRRAMPSHVNSVFKDGASSGTSHEKKTARRKVALPCEEPVDTDISYVHPGTLLTTPQFHGGRVIAAYADTRLADGEMPSFVDGSIALEQAILDVNAGDLSGLEGLLVAQAHALNVIFTSAITRARKLGTSEALSTLGSLAMRAQSQSRQAIDSIVALKFPRQPTAFIKQQNVAASGGQQIVQNGASNSRAPAYEEPLPNKLLVEANASPILEPRATRRSGCSNQTLEAVEVRHRAAQPARKGSRGT